MREPAFRVARVAWIAVAISVLSACGGSGDSPATGPGPMPGPAQSLEISPDTSAVLPGNVLHLTATLMKTDGTQTDVTSLANWSVSNNVIALASPGGRIIAISPGSTSVTASYQGSTGETAVDVIGSIGSVAPGYAYFLTKGVAQFQIESNGSIVPVSASAVPAGSNPSSIVADPAGHYVYVVDTGDAASPSARVFQYAIGAGGALNAMSPPYVGIPATNVEAKATIDPQGRFLYVLLNQAANGASAIAQYAIGSNGGLRALQPFVINVAPNASSLTIEPTGQFAYLLASQLQQFSIGNTGSLTLMGTPITASGDDFVIAPSGRYGYTRSNVGGSTGNIQITNFSIGADGALSRTGMTTFDYSSTFSPFAVDLLFGGAGPSAYLLVDYPGAVENAAGGVAIFHVNADGTFTLNAPQFGYDGAPNAGAIYGPNVYVLTYVCAGPLCTGQQYLERYAIDDSGALHLAGETGLAFVAHHLILLPAN